MPPTCRRTFLPHPYPYRSAVFPNTKTFLNLKARFSRFRIRPWTRPILGGPGTLRNFNWTSPTRVQQVQTKMAHESRSPPCRRRHHPIGDGDNGYHRRDDSRGEFRGRDDRNGGPRRWHADNGWGDRDKERPSDRRYSGRDHRRPEYDERERNRERDRDRDTHRDGASRTGPSRRSASPSRPSRPRSVISRSRSHSGSRSASAVDKSKPNFAPSGLLAAATNTVRAVDGTSTVLKYNEPPEARKPVLGWRLYVFKGSEQVGKPISFLTPVFGTNFCGAAC